MRGKDCRCSHDKSEGGKPKDRSASPQQELAPGGRLSIPCSFHQKGNCRYGAGCAFSHAAKPSAEVAPASSNPPKPKKDKDKPAAKASPKREAKPNTVAVATVAQSCCTMTIRPTARKSVSFGTTTVKEYPVKRMFTVHY